MISILFTAVLVQTPPSLADIYAKIAKMPGVELRAEVIAPSVVPMHFLIAPGGRLVATYPTTVQYITPERTITWMPDRREYGDNKNESLNPLPAGFEILWPTNDPNVQTGGPTKETFEKKACWSYPCKAANGQVLNLFVDQATMLPYGTRATANNVTYEMVYRSVKVRAIAQRELQFVPPKDARVAKPGPPVVNMIKTGTKLPSFSATDHSGKRHTLDALLKNKKGLIFNFWFSSCTGCVAEMPYLVKLHPTLTKARIGLIGVNAIDGASIVGRTAKKSQLPYPTLVGEGSKGITKNTGVLGYPVTLVIDNKRMVVDAILGFDEARLTAAIDKLKAN